MCATCAVEYDEPLPAVCPICADERQWVPADGQKWTDLATLRAARTTLQIVAREPGLVSLTAAPRVGIGQTAQLVVTDHGCLLWDPPGYLDADAVARVSSYGRVVAVAASHPHMFGVQVEWARALDAAVLVCEADGAWLGRTDPRVEFWNGRHEVAPGVTLHQVGGHFPGSAVALWDAGADARGVLLTGDSVYPNPDRASVGFLRSYPNKIPLSAAVVDRIATQLSTLRFDRIIGNFGNTIDHDGRAVLRRSADRHMAWVRGDHDDLT